MLRFSIREILLFTLMAALAIGWGVHSRRQSQEITQLRLKLEESQDFDELIRRVVTTIKPTPFGQLEGDEEPSSEAANSVRESE